MIQALIFDMLPRGDRPILGIEPANKLPATIGAPAGPPTVPQYRCLQFNGHLLPYDFTWDQGFCTNQLFLPLRLDLSLEGILSGLPDWIQYINDTFPYESGTLIFITGLQSSVGVQGQDVPDVPLAGIAYVPEILMGSVQVRPEDNVAQVILGALQGDIEALLFFDGSVERRQERVRAYRRAQADRARFEQEYLVFKQAADERALKLLSACLTPSQQRDLRTKKHFDLTVSDGRTFRICERNHQNVFRLENGEAVEQFCVVASVEMPVYDLMLAQKLLLESNLKAFMKIANRWDLTGDLRTRVFTQLFDVDDIYFQQVGVNLRGLERLRMEQEMDRMVIERLPEAVGA